MHVHEIQHHHLKSGQVKPFLELGANELWPEAEAAGARVVAVFGVVIGQSPTAMVLVEHAQDSLETLLSQADPARRPPSHDRLAELVVSSDNRLVVPSGRWPLRPIPPDGIFTLRAWKVAPGAIDRFHRHTAEILWPLGLESEQGTYLGLWTTAVGRPGEILMFSRYDSMDHWERTRPEPPTSATPEQVRNFRQAMADRDQTSLSTDMSVYRRLAVWPKA